MNKCEYCGRMLRKHEVVHGIRFGILDDATGNFLPARDSAATVICQSCGEMLLKTVYIKLKVRPPQSTKSAKPRSNYR